MSGLDAGTGAGLEEALNAFMPEASDHEESVAHSATHSKCDSSPMVVRIPEPTQNKGSEN
ncbi:MAG: hypothetical protein ACR2I0_13575 [Rhodoferax sp.]